MLGAALLLTGGLVAHAAADRTSQTRHGACATASPDAVDCHFTHSGAGEAGGVLPGGPSPAPGQGQPSAPSPPDPNNVYTWELRHEGGRPCWYGGSYPVTDPAERARRQAAADAAYQAQSHGAAFPQCPSQLPARGASTSAPDGATGATPGFVRTAAVRQQLGSPVPRIQPGRAIAGKTAYLEVGGPGQRDFTIADPLGGPGAQIHATPTYRIDWGDGTVTETSSNGGPWPHGDVTHTYQRTGRYDVLVTARWTARWSGAAGEGGDLTGLTTEGRISRFLVTEIQAVRER